jgi:ABC-type transporter MlaC component
LFWQHGLSRDWWWQYSFSIKEKPLYEGETEMKLLPSLVAASLVATSLGSSLRAQAQTGKSTVDKVVQIFTMANSDSSNRQVNSDIEKYIDYRNMAQHSLGNDEWKKLSPAQKDQFTGTLRTLIEQRYYARWHRLFSKGKMTFVGETNSGADTTVKTNLTIGKKVDPLEWRLQPEGGQLKVISLAVGDADLLQKLTGRLQGRLNKYGFNGLLTWMKNKAKIGPNDKTEEASTGSAR